MNDKAEAGVIDCSLCIVGGGIAGLNALFVAAQYLGKDDRVILIERRPRTGGMWNDVYDYVHLHQPYERFTAGDIGWTLDQPPAYLASKPEVLGQFEHCLEHLRGQFRLQEYYGYEMTDDREVPVTNGYAAELRVRAIDADGDEITIRADKLIKAFGFRIPVNPALSLSSSRVQSLSTDLDDLQNGVIASDNRPVYVVGGGKTGMDTVNMLIDRFPSREIHFLIGNGTIFTSRDKFFPAGLRRWVGGSTTVGSFLEIALRFNGDNEDEVFDYFHENYALSLDNDSQNFVFGVLSEREQQAIKNGCASITRDYLEDVIDTGNGPQAQLRGGDSLPVEEGAYFINCSGYVLREDYEYLPYLSEHGTTVTVHPNSAIHFLTTFSSYFLTHLFFLDLLDKLPLYELDMQSLNERNKKALPFTAISLALYNLGLIVDAVPQDVLLRCGLDFDRWYPLYRRILAISRLRQGKLAKRAHFRATLDRMQQRYGIRLGLLERNSGMRADAAA